MQNHQQNKTALSSLNGKQIDTSTIRTRKRAASAGEVLAIVCQQSTRGLSLVNAALDAWEKRQNAGLAILLCGLFIPAMTKAQTVEVPSQPQPPIVQDQSDEQEAILDEREAIGMVEDDEAPFGAFIHSYEDNDVDSGSAPDSMGWKKGAGRKHSSSRHSHSSSRSSRGGWHRKH